MTADTVYRDRYVEADGLKTRYIEDGSGPPVILMHGASLGSTADVFTRTLGPLAAFGLRVIAYDQPGSGRTDVPTDHTVAYRRGFILKFMDALGIDKAAIVGHSQAGGMAVGLAFENPDRISRIVVLGGGSLLPPLPGGAKPSGPAEGRDDTPEEPTIQDTQKLLEANLFHHELITMEALAERHSLSVGRNFDAFVERGKAKEPAGSKPAMPLCDRLDQCPADLLMIYGKQDRGNAAERFEILRQRSPQIEAHLIDGCKHLVPWDAADDYVKLAGPFLTR